MSILVYSYHFWFWIFHFFNGKEFILAFKKLRLQWVTNDKVKYIIKLYTICYEVSSC